MTVPEGHFRMYPSMAPPLKAGGYRFDVRQDLAAVAPDGSARSASQLPVDTLATHVEVTSPRYQLPPDQILSTFPPAGSEGAYGSRLPQIVIKRRTLPWERSAADGTPATTPWLALVVIAEGEAELVLNAPVAQCVTPGVNLPGASDVSTANYLRVRRSVIDDVLPTRKDVPLLAHVREVDISDTELMMGDDDGFVAVVVGNRLPLAGRTAEGEEAPVKYLAALVSLEGQFDTLLPEAPAPVDVTSGLLSVLKVPMPAPELDVLVMQGGEEVTRPVDLVTDIAGAGGVAEIAGLEDLGGPGRSDPRPRAATDGVRELAVLASDATTPAYSSAAGWPTDTVLDSGAVSALLAQDFVREIGHRILDPVHHFPVLAHWSFTSSGETTFESLMTNLDSGLLGTPSTREPAPPPPTGRARLQVIETGHVALPHRTRLGDHTSAWSRGPLTPHPMDLAADRLPLAHAADQLRIVVPDGREDLSLATAFEIGRLMALSHPSLVDSLMRWRQRRFQLARGRTLLTAETAFDLDRYTGSLRELPQEIARRLIEPLVARPAAVIGEPLVLRPPGTDMHLVERLDLSGSMPEIIAAGLAVDADLGAAAEAVFEALHTQPVRVVADLDTRTAGTLTGLALHGALEESVGLLAASTLGGGVAEQITVGEVAWDVIDPAVLDLDRIDLDRIDVGGGLLDRLDGTVVGPAGPVVGPRSRPRDVLDDLIGAGSDDPDDPDDHDPDAGDPAGPDDEKDDGR